MRIGTRGSALALAQARQVAALLDGEHELVEVVTSGDREPFPAPSDKERWVRELDRALLDGAIDCAVHSAKDVPATLPDGVVIAAVPPRADPRDALCGASALAALPEGARVGTSSLRRAAQLRALRADLDVAELRGNVDTRLRKLAEGGYDAIVLALAGLQRLGRGEAGAPLDELVPAAGQGCLAVTTRAGEEARVRALTHEPSARALAAERALVRALEADCHTPVGAHARGDERPDPARLRRRLRRQRLGARRARRRRSGGAGGRGGRAAAERRRAGGARMTAYLVGAGPGDPGLLTARALELIAAADVILHDRLIPGEALAGARPGAEVIDVGKVGGGEQVPQEETTRLLVEHARAGRTVVRLKGGDPFVFGRGGEEAQALRAAGCEYEIVPGVTAGVAAPAYAGIPVTQRGLASAVAFVTGHEDPSKPETAVDWAALAAFPGTLVFYMGVRQLPRIAEQLAAHGRDPGQPAAIVERGTLPEQRVLRTTLAALGEQDARAPAVTVVGPVAALADELAWLGRGPLAGQAIAVTRARAQASGLAARLRALGARVVEAPAIRIEPLDLELPDPRGYDLLVLTSPNGVEQLFARVRDARALAGPTIAVIGPGTAAALRARGVEPDVVPRRAVGEGLAEALAGRAFARALVARAQDARDLVPDALRAAGTEVDDVALYRTVAEPLDDDARAAALRADWATFTSASSVRFFHEAAGTLDGPRLASIGPVTSAALRELGREPDLEASDHTPDGLIAALVEAAGRR